MKKDPIVLSLIFVFISVGVMAQPLVTSLQGNGMITWTDPGFQSNSLYRIEWASKVTESWKQDWQGLQFMEMESTSQSVGVPMFYRVVRQTNSGKIVGSWGIGREGQHRFMTLTFYPDGHYIHWEANGAGQTTADGIEIGDYSYDAITGLLTTTSFRDDNGALGLTSAKSQPRQHSALVVDDVLVLKSPDASRCLLSRVVDSQAPIVGGWSDGTTGNRLGYLTLTFYANGYYIHWQTADPEPDTSEGVEYGIYTYNPANGELIATALRDDNGTMGLCGDPDASLGDGRYAATMTIVNDVIVEFGAPRVQ